MKVRALHQISLSKSKKKMSFPRIQMLLMQKKLRVPFPVRKYFMYFNFTNVKNYEVFR